MIPVSKFYAVKSFKMTQRRVIDCLCELCESNNNCLKLLPREVCVFPKITSFVKHVLSPYFGLSPAVH